MRKNRSSFGLQNTYDNKNLSQVLYSSESGRTEGPHFSDTIKPPQDLRAIYLHSINGKSIPFQGKNKESIRKNNAHK